ncbi:MAG: response regulator, partial [Flavobacteriales bacterium]|nr:response regulator [Flavobacteriales bacterium]
MNILIVEDEAAALKRMEKLLKEIDPEVNIVGRTGTVKETVEWLEDNEWPDLAFFDIQLADGESFEVFHRTEVGCPVIFTTAYDEHALKAFRVNAVDYLLKPVRKGELSEAMERAG